MTKVFFVRHAQPEHSHKDDRTRPLTDEGKSDAKIALDILKDKSIDAFYCSPYKRSMDTIRETAEFYGMEIITDERLRERKCGNEGNSSSDMLQKRWADFSFCEEDGETLGSVQKRNIEALSDILRDNANKNIVIGTHGTALSTILNYYDPSFGCDDFLRIVDLMPYIIELDFEGTALVSKSELGYAEKEFKGKNRFKK